MNELPIPFAPPRASEAASRIDALFLFELGVSGFFVALIFVLIVYFAVRYRRQSETFVPPLIDEHMGLEITWMAIPFALLMVMFFWGASLYVKIKKPLDNALEINVVGKQWMWKIQHPSGVREISELHVPTGRPVKLIMASQDVIHDFFIPAFRIKQDVVPGSYSTQWFVATQPGKYHLFCAQYCGLNHSGMTGDVVVMSPADYQSWLAGAVPSDPPATAGQKLFSAYGCAVCHGQRAPTMAGLFMSRVRLQDGSVVTADENYLRESILDSTAKIVAGYPQVMPSYQGQFSEEQLYQLIAYIKSLGPVRNAPVPSPAPAPLDAPTTRPAPGDQPNIVPNFPPAQESNPTAVPPGR